MSEKNHKTIALVISGNILDYYDFMLFAHLASMLSSVFFPGLTPTQVHLLGLVFFAVPFVVRPIGGYFFGKISDQDGRGQALGETLKWASLASLGLACLPGYEIGGMVSGVCFVLLRALQGLSLGGEYTTAGTLLMERFVQNRGFLSGVVGASGTVGSLMAFGFSWFYLNDYLPPEAWRYAFGLGALATYLSYLLRRKLIQERAQRDLLPPLSYSLSFQAKSWIVLLTGLYIGVLIWTPMIYANFYLTKILSYPASTGLTATLIALLGSIILTPLAGLLADRFPAEKVMTWSALLSIPLSFSGYALLTQGNLVGQLLLISSVALFGAPMHLVMNPLFQASHRSRYVNTFFMIGASLGSLVPGISGFLSSQYHFDYGPVVFVVFFGSLTFWVFFRCFTLYSKVP